LCRFPDLSNVNFFLDRASGRWQEYHHWKYPEDIFMTPEQVFGLTGPPVLLGWAILVIGPRGSAWLNAVPQVLIPLGLSILYGVLVLRFFSEPGGGYGSLADVRQLFSSDWVLLAGWVHYLAFDLAIGAYLTMRMDKVGIGRIVQAPILLTTFLFGPIGFALAIITEAALSARPALTRMKNPKPEGVRP
jgi:hypothetical protein